MESESELEKLRKYGLSEADALLVLQYNGETKTRESSANVSSKKRKADEDEVESCKAKKPRRGKFVWNEESTLALIDEYKELAEKEEFVTEKKKKLEEQRMGKALSQVYECHPDPC